MKISDTSVFNFASYGMYSSYTLQGFVATIPNVKILPEKLVTTFLNNRLVVWDIK